MKLLLVIILLSIVGFIVYVDNTADADIKELAFQHPNVQQYNEKQVRLYSCVLDIGIQGVGIIDKIKFVLNGSNDLSILETTADSSRSIVKMCQVRLNEDFE